MSICGTSFSGDWAAGAHMDFSIGSAGLADLFKAGYTLAVLAKCNNSNAGMFGGYSAAGGTGALRHFFMSNNSGARMFGDGDFSSGYPSSGGGLNDDVWRWYIMSKVTGSTHYRMHLAELATLTWSHGESTSSGNHSDPATTATYFSTWANYANGNNNHHIAVIAPFNSNKSDGAIEAACTMNLSDMYAAGPKALWAFPAATAGSTVLDLMGGGADETARQFITTSADPSGFDFTLSTPAIKQRFLPFFS